MTESKNSEILKNNGIKNTRQRNIILEILKEIQKPLTAESIFARLLEKDYVISLSTIYRILDVYVSKGIAVKSILSSENSALFELRSESHKHYLICTRCKKVLSFESCPLENYEKALQQKTKYNITGHRLELYGFCPECKDRC